MAGRRDWDGDRRHGGYDRGPGRNIVSAMDQAPAGYGDADDDYRAYLRNEYRAERGAYLEPRPGAVQQNPEPPGRRWGPDLPDPYIRSAVSRTGTGAPLEREPFGLYRASFRPEAEPVRPPPVDDRMERERFARGRAVADRHRAEERHRRGGERLWRGLDRFGAEVESWFGGEERGGPHRGLGPRGYRRRDDRILEDLYERLTDDPHLDASDVEVRVANGEVTLDGLVASRFAKRRAEDIAETVSGVGHVQNNLRLRAGSEASGGRTVEGDDARMSSAALRQSRAGDKA